jgi:hypothetical protein
MDHKKLEKLENIRNFLENDNIGALNRYIVKIKPLVVKDDDFDELFSELNAKNYDRALLITEDVIFEIKGTKRNDDSDDYSYLDDFEENDDFMYNEKEAGIDDLELGAFDGDSFFDDQEDDY